MGGSINGGFLSVFLDEEEEEEDVRVVSSVSEIRNTLDVELIERWR